MRKLFVMAGVAMALGAGGANAKTVSDPTGDFLPSYTGAKDPDLDVTSFTVDYNPATSDFSLMATFAGPINPAEGGLYVIGVDTGLGKSKPFASIGEPNVAFDQVIILQQSGAGSVSGNALTATLSGNEFSVDVPLADLPSTGAQPQDYGFNLWPRNSSNQISDFAPDNALLSSVPEPSVWAMMIAGLVMVGGAMRLRRRQPRAVAV
jgi:hypothetical protein